MVFFLESGRAGGALKRGANAPQLFCCMQKKYILRSGLLQFFKIILDGISFYSVFFYSYFVMKSILLPLRMIRSDLSFDETGLLSGSMKTLERSPAERENMCTLHINSYCVLLFV